MFFYNIYFFGYLWTIYLALLYGGTFFIKHKNLLIEYGQSAQIVCVPTNINTIISHYTDDIRKIILHPLWQKNIMLIRKTGDYLITAMKYIVIWGIRTHFPQLTNTNLEKIETYFSNDPLLKNEISLVRKIMGDIEVVEQIHNKILGQNHNLE
jgi:hypothetical protein